jgi:cytosine/adenosine deaminase-related metal-dependent hydrolase
MSMILKARYVAPVDRPVIENGVVQIEAGRITAVDTTTEFPLQMMIDYGDAVICPAFVNAHTHLELSHLFGKVPPSPDLVDWLCRLVTVSKDAPSTPESVARTVNAAIRHSVSCGVTCFGDVTRIPALTRGPLAESGLHIVSFGEVIATGTRRDRLDERLDAAASTEHESPRLRIGISPHAPYSVEPDGLAACARKARQMNAPLCIHLAESRDEDAFTRHGAGPFAELGRQLGIWDEGVPISGCSPVELAFRTGVLTRRTVIAHGNYLTESDIELIAESGASVAYCPRTHAAFEHKPHPFRRLLASGVNVCIGTDSLASNPSLSVLDELRFMSKRDPDFPREALLAMGTLHGAEAIGFADELGSISPGKCADLAVIPIESTTTGWSAIFDGSHRPVAVYHDGEQVDVNAD